MSTACKARGFKFTATELRNAVFKNWEYIPTKANKTDVRKYTKEQLCKFFRITDLKNTDNPETALKRRKEPKPTKKTSGGSKKMKASSTKRRPEAPKPVSKKSKSEVSTKRRDNVPKPKETEEEEVEEEEEEVKKPQKKKSKVSTKRRPDVAKAKKRKAEDEEEEEESLNMKKKKKVSTKRRSESPKRKAAKVSTKRKSETSKRKIVRKPSTKRKSDAEMEKMEEEEGESALDEDAEEEDNFWDRVEEFHWGSGESNIEDIASKYSKRAMQDFYDQVVDKVLQMKKVLEPWVLNKKTPKIPVSADDESFDDLVEHIVGLGRNEYNKVMDRPAAAVKIANSSKFKKIEPGESFLYAVKMVIDSE